MLSPGASGARRRRCWSACGSTPADPDLPRRRPLRRQPAEGPVRQVAVADAAPADRRRADPRRRRRRQVRGSTSCWSSWPPNGMADPPDLLRDRRAGRALPPRRGDVARPHRGRPRRRRGARGPHPPRRLRQRRRVARRRGAGMSSEALAPSRVAAGLNGRALLAWARDYGIVVALLAALRRLRGRHRHLPDRTQPDQPRPAVGRAGPARRRDDAGDHRRRVRPLGRGDPRLRRRGRRHRRQRGGPGARGGGRGRRRGRAGADQRHDRHPAADPVLPRHPGDPVRDRRGRDLPHRRHQQLPRHRLPRLPAVRQRRAAGDPVQGLDRAGRLRRDLGGACAPPATASRSTRSAATRPRPGSPGSGCG